MSFCVHGSQSAYDKAHKHIENLLTELSVKKRHSINFIFLLDNSLKFSMNLENYLMKMKLMTVCHYHNSNLLYIKHSSLYLCR